MVKKLTLADANAAAAAHGGKCLATVYQNNRTKMPWQCGKCGHIWDQNLNTIKLGSWCPQCAGNVRLTIETARQIARDKDGVCLSTDYSNNRTPLLWQCRCGHKWSSSLGNVKDRGKWCPNCSGNLKLTLDEARSIAAGRGGRCLSISYSNNHSSMDWECGACKTTWPASLHNIKSGRWCPNCLHKGEAETRAIFETLTGHPFPHKRGVFAENPMWDLDGYSEKFGIAFEYHGRQHYEYVPTFFHRGGPELFERQQARDYAVERGVLELEEPIYLIVVPYWLSSDDREQMIHKELWLLGATAIEP